jgi:phosphoglycerate kinase
VPDYAIPHLILFTGNITEAGSQSVVKNLPAKDIIILENIRYYAGEDTNDPAFAAQLAGLADVYINDAFAVCHRAAASTVAITKLMPSFAGPLLEQELKNLSYVTKNPTRPVVALMGGIKISDKAKTLERLASKADYILVGGGIANLLLKAQGISIGQSKIEAEAEQTAWHILQNFKDKLVLPKDVVVARSDFSNIRAVPVNQIGEQDAIFDLGPQTILAFSQTLKDAQTIIWNGPLGFFEHKPFHTATMALARVIGGVASGQAFAVVGGGETVDAVRQAGQETYFDHVSTGGGAMLEYLAGTTLPAIAALDK